MEALTAITPIDGRYRAKTERLGNYFSEYALMRYRVRVEVEYYLALLDFVGTDAERSLLTAEAREALRDIYRHFSVDDARHIKQTESVTNHDVKAVEYFVKERLTASPLLAALPTEQVHFGLTSQDINNTAYPLMLKDALTEVLLPLHKQFVEALTARAGEWDDIPMLARTHGQPASPTRLGKELGVFAYRVQEQLTALTAIPFTAKFGGATGNFNAHHVAYPDADWRTFADRFVASLGLRREQWTTQISNYDHLAALLQGLQRINVILIDFCRDVWQYISLEYFKQRIKEGEVGSSAMPHKVNPIDFENAEGNLGIANALFGHIAGKLPVSRLQRDLTDSTVLRNLGVPVAHTVVALESLLKGLDRLLLNEAAIRRDLDDQWNVVAEGLQTILRREGYPKPYEALKALTRTNEAVTEQTISRFIDSLDVAESVKDELRAITPRTYTGIKIN